MRFRIEQHQRTGESKYHHHHEQQAWSDTGTHHATQKRRHRQPKAHKHHSRYPLTSWGCAFDVEKIGLGLLHPPVAVGIVLIDHHGRVVQKHLITRKVVFSIRDGMEAPWEDPGFGKDCWFQWWAPRPELVAQLKQWSLMSPHATVQDMAAAVLHVLASLGSYHHTAIHYVSDYPSYDETCLEMLVTVYGNRSAEKTIRYITHLASGNEIRIPLDSLEIVEWLPARIQAKLNAWVDKRYGKATHDPLADALHHAGMWFLLQRIKARLTLLPSSNPAVSIKTRTKAKTPITTS